MLYNISSQGSIDLTVQDKFIGSLNIKIKPKPINPLVYCLTISRVCYQLFLLLRKLSDLPTLLNFLREM